MIDINKIAYRIPGVEERILTPNLLIREKRRVHGFLLSFGDRKSKVAHVVTFRIFAFPQLNVNGDKSRFPFAVQ